MAGRRRLELYERWNGLQMQSDFFRQDQPSRKHTALRIAAGYAMAGAVWIVFSDLLVARFFGDSKTFFLLQTAKGWFFIAATALLLYVIIHRSVRSLQRSEKALMESRQSLSNLLGNLPGMAYESRSDEERTLRFVSAGCYELTGYLPSDLFQKRLDDLTHPADLERVHNEIHAALQEMRTFRLTYRIVSATGDEKWVWEQGFGVYSPLGELIAIEGFVTDITERKRAEEALRESEERYRALVEGISHAILMVDKDRNIMSVNQAFVDLFGYEKEELKGKSVRIVHPSEDSFMEFGRRAYPVLKNMGPLRTEWQLMHKDGTIFPIEGTYSAVKGRDGSIQGYVGVIRDITDRKKAEAELQRYRDQLEEMVMERTRDLEIAQKALVQREKLKTLGAISAEVAHEIRNPLVSIGGFARRLQKRYPDSKEAAIILKECHRLEIMLDRIKNYLKPIEIKPRECPVNRVVAECVDLLSPELDREQVTLQLELEQNLSDAFVDPDILIQVFVDVIRSSVRIMGTNRRLVIRTYSGNQNIFVEFKSPAMEKKIKDPELLLLPFEEGEQGIGVSFSYKLLKGMGGVLTLSQYKEYLVFTISLLKSDSLEAEKEKNAGEFA